MRECKNVCACIGMHVCIFVHLCIGMCFFFFFLMSACTCDCISANFYVHHSTTAANLCQFKLHDYIICACLCVLPVTADKCMSN